MTVSEKSHKQNCHRDLIHRGNVKAVRVYWYDGEFEKFVLYRSSDTLAGCRPFVKELLDMCFDRTSIDVVDTRNKRRKKRR